jgi:nucleoside 2-deoxyribosyltransferase
MERVMQTCDAMIVNLTPFRGPSADVGSAYEMGFMRALGRPIFAYSNDSRLFVERVRAFSAQFPAGRRTRDMLR